MHKIGGDVLSYLTCFIDGREGGWRLDIDFPDKEISKKFTKYNIAS
jgi:hypothetical protein